MPPVYSHNIIILIFINTYPIARFRDMLFESKHDPCKPDVGYIINPLRLDDTIPEEVSKVMEFLDDMK